MKGSRPRALIADSAERVLSDHLELRFSAKKCFSFRGPKFIWCNPTQSSVDRRKRKEDSSRHAEMIRDVPVKAPRSGNRYQKALVRFLRPFPPQVKGVFHWSLASLRRPQCELLRVGSSARSMWRFDARNYADPRELLFRRP